MQKTNVIQNVAVNDAFVTFNQSYVKMKPW